MMLDVPRGWLVCGTSDVKLKYEFGGGGCVFLLLIRARIGCF